MPVRRPVVTVLASSIAVSEAQNQTHSNYWLVVTTHPISSSVLGAGLQMTANTLKAFPPVGFLRLSDVIPFW